MLPARPRRSPSATQYDVPEMCKRYRLIGFQDRQNGILKHVEILDPQRLCPLSLAVGCGQSGAGSPAKAKRTPGTRYPVSRIIRQHLSPSAPARRRLRRNRAAPWVLRKGLKTAHPRRCRTLRRRSVQADLPTLALARQPFLGQGLRVIAAVP